MKLLLTLPFAALTLSLLQEPGSKPAAPAKVPTVVKVGDKLPASLKLRDIDGKEITPETMKGKVVCMTFWSITCPIMIGKEPEFAALQKFCDDKGKDVMFLAVNSNNAGRDTDELEGAPPAKDAKDTYPRIRAYMKEKGMNFTVIADHNSVFADLVAAESTPHCFVFDKDGVLRFSGAIDDNQRGNNKSPQLFPQEAVAACLAGKEPKVSSNKPYGCTIKRAGGGRRR